MDETTLVVSLVEGPEIFEGLRITRKFKEDGLEMVSTTFVLYIDQDEKNLIIHFIKIQ